MGPGQPPVFVLGSLAMTGIPPLLGFVSKWALAEAAVLPWAARRMVAGAVALIISAILTGTYMMVPVFTLYTARRANGAPGSLLSAAWACPCGPHWCVLAAVHAAVQLLARAIDRCWTT